LGKSVRRSQCSGLLRVLLAFPSERALHRPGVQTPGHGVLTARRLIVTPTLSAASKSAGMLVHTDQRLDADAAQEDRVLARRGRHRDARALHDPGNGFETVAPHRAHLASAASSRTALSPAGAARCSTGL
jgi:hypothetical protein